MALDFAGLADSADLEDRCAKARPLACWKLQPVSGFASASEPESTASHNPEEDAQGVQEKEVGISVGTPGTCWAPYHSQQQPEEAGDPYASAALGLARASHVAAEPSAPLEDRWLGCTGIVGASDHKWHTGPLPPDGLLVLDDLPWRDGCCDCWSRFEIALVTDRHLVWKAECVPGMASDSGFERGPALEEGLGCSTASPVAEKAVASSVADHV